MVLYEPWDFFFGEIVESLNWEIKYEDRTFLVERTWNDSPMAYRFKDGYLHHISNQEPKRDLDNFLDGVGHREDAHIIYCHKSTEGFTLEGLDLKVFEKVNKEPFIFTRIIFGYKKWMNSITREKLNLPEIRVGHYVLVVTEKKVIQWDGID